jgi:hypothetical protein
VNSSFAPASLGQAIVVVAFLPMGFCLGQEIAHEVLLLFPVRVEPLPVRGLPDLRQFVERFLGKLQGLG